MGLADSFTKPVSPCMNPDWQFPTITAPGMPNFVLGCFLANFAGINYALQFIPPTPQNLPNIKPPSLDLFIKAFMAGINLPSSYPGFMFIPPVGSPPYKFDLSGMMKFIAAGIQLPFKLITELINGLLQLTIKLPTLDGIASIFANICLEIGIDTSAVKKFVKCLASSIFSLFTSLI